MASSTSSLLGVDSVRTLVYYITKNAKGLIVTGGLACAISCRREGLDVVMLEKAGELSEVRWFFFAGSHCGTDVALTSTADRCRHPAPSMSIQPTMTIPYDRDGG